MFPVTSGKYRNCLPHKEVTLRIRRRGMARIGPAECCRRRRDQQSANVAVLVASSVSR